MCLTMQKSPNFQNVRLRHRRQFIIGGLPICAFLRVFGDTLHGHGWQSTFFVAIHCDYFVISYNEYMGVLSNIINYNFQIHSQKEVYVLFRELKYNRFSLPDKVERRLRFALAYKSLKPLYKRELNRYFYWLNKHENETDENKRIRIFGKNDIKELPIIKKKLKLKYNMKGLGKRDYRPGNDHTIDTSTHNCKNPWVTILYTPMGNKR